MSDQNSADILSLTAQIVSAYLSNNQIETNALPSLIQSVYRSLSTVEEVEPPPAPARNPAVPVKKSVFPDSIVCLEDWKKLKMLKRHLHASYGLTPNVYRARRALPPDYPMVPPNYAATRSSLAKTFGLGRKPAVVAIGSAEPDVVKIAARRARGSRG